MDVFGFIKKGKDLVNTAKALIEKANVLLEDEDHNGRPDIQDNFDKAVEFVVEKGKAHIALLKDEVKALGDILLKIKEKIDEVSVPAKEDKK